MKLKFQIGLLLQTAIQVNRARSPFLERCKAKVVEFAFDLDSVQFSYTNLNLIDSQHDTLLLCVPELSLEYFAVETVENLHFGDVFASLQLHKIEMFEFLQLADSAVDVELLLATELRTLFEQSLVATLH